MRTMEIFRQCGVEDTVRAAGLPLERTGYMIWAETLAGRENRAAGRAALARGWTGIERGAPLPLRAG
jgi:hypothetical protein